MKLQTDKLIPFLMTKIQQKPSLTFTLSWPIDYFMKKMLSDLQKIAFLLFSVFVFSCENPGEIGFDLDGTQNGASIYTDTLSLDISTVLADSTVNGKSNYLMFGNVTDPIFGNIKATTYFQPTMVGYTDVNGAVAYDTLKVNANPIADSLRLRLVNFGLIYGDTLAKNFFSIHRLKSPMDYNKRYNAEDKLEYESTEIAKFGVTLKSFKNDSAFNSYYIDLPKSIAQEILNAAPSINGDNSKFVSAFPGFAIVSEGSNKSVYTILTGPYSASTSTLIADWHYEGDTTKYFYQFDLNGPRHTSFEFDRSGTALAALSKSNNEINSNKTGNLSYIQGGSGISTKINFDNISKLGTNIKVSKAILEFNTLPNSLDGLYPKVFNYVLAETGTNNQQLRSSGNIPTYLTPIGNDLSGVSFTLDTTQTVNLDITNFLQKLTNKKVTSTSIILMPAALLSTGNGILANDNLRRMVFTKPKLKIYYSKY
ncbi:DUF4270 family protein [Lacihabitans sp. LS3-19]|uniref:DUF4270 family protein n=1 Tax=Lacihabitans sp. LS3-19 TaxID=2487335 RepID=UPI0020CBCDB1|nr:DUF4270 family protein [Lacihabitans sp. LS3-19]MCP9770334.1 DUF4270 family protein [Lacihabitans sp. LS3-19]